MVRTDVCGLGGVLLVVVGLDDTAEVEEMVWGVSPEV